MTNAELATWGCVGMGSVWGCLLTLALWQAWPSVRAVLALSAASVATAVVASQLSGGGWSGGIVTGGSATATAVCVALVFNLIARRHAHGPSRG